MELFSIRIQRTFQLVSTLVCFQDIKHIVFDFVEFINKHNKRAYKHNGERNDKIFAQFLQYIHNIFKDLIVIL